MNIQPVSQSLNFGTSICTKQRRDNQDRQVTVADMYEMEDRINQKNEELIRKQNKLLGEAIKALANVDYYGREEYHQKAYIIGSKLENSGI